MSNEAHYDVVNVGSSRLATDGECIRDAFVKINNNYTQIFNTILDYDVVNQEFNGWKLVVGIDNSIVISNSINISNNVNVNIANMVANTNNIDLDFNVENSLNVNVERNLNLSVNNGSVSIVTNTNNDIEINSNRVIFQSDVYAESFLSNNSTNVISLSNNDIDITTTTGDINIDASTNSTNFTGDIVVNNNMFNIDASTGDVNIQNGAITIDNSGDVVMTNVNINNTLTVDASNNINMGINNTINIDNSQNVTFAPSTTIDFTNTIINNIDVDIMDIMEFNVTPSLIENGQILIWNDTAMEDCGAFEAGTLSLGSLSDVISDPSTDEEILIYNQQANTWVSGRPELYDFAMTNRDIIPTQNHGVSGQEEVGLTVGSSEYRYSAMFANRFNGDLEGSVFADDSSMIIDGTDGRVVGDVENNSVITGRVKSQDDIDLYVFAGGTGSVILAGQSNVSIGHTSGQVDIYGDVEFNNGTTAFQSGNDVSFNCPVKFTQSAPASSIGADTDLQGAVAFDSNYIYYCTADYDSVTNIWKRVAWSGDTW